MTPPFLSIAAIAPSEALWTSMLIFAAKISAPWNRESTWKVKKQGSKNKQHPDLWQKDNIIMWCHLLAQDDPGGRERPVSWIPGFVRPFYILTLQWLYVHIVIRWVNTLLLHWKPALKLSSFSPQIRNFQSVLSLFPVISYKWFNLHHHTASANLCFIYCNNIWYSSTVVVG